METLIRFLKEILTYKYSDICSTQQTSILKVINPHTTFDLHTGSSKCSLIHINNDFHKNYQNE